MNNQPNNTQPPFKRTARIKILWRYVVVSTLIVLFAACIVRAMIYTTVIHRDKWVEKANVELMRRDTIYPDRGEILAADGSVLATNLNYYTLRIDYRASRFREDEFVAAIDSLSDSLALHYPIRTADQWRTYLLKPLDKPKNERPRSYTLLRDLSYSESEEVKTYPFFHRWKNPNKTGLTRDKILKRTYPYGQMARRSIGRVGQTKTSSRIHGVSGLEYALDSLLYGHPGVAKKVPLTHKIVNWTDIPPTNGYTVTTTIDIGIQDILETELNRQLTETSADWGTAVLMEVETGDIKAISNLERDSAGNYLEAINRAVMRFEPGSVMKTITMVIAMEEGFVKNLDEVYHLGGGVVFGGGSPIVDTHSPADLPVRRFLEYSSNIGMTKLVAPHYRDYPNGLRDRIKEMGLFERFNTGIAGEVAPYFPNLSVKDGGLVTLGRQTWGYGNQISPLYLCAFYNAVANDGKFVRPRLVSKITTERGDSVIPVSYIREKICSERTARDVRDMLRLVVTGEGGTAKNLKKSTIPVAGKTGTAKVAKELSEADREKLRKNPKDSTVHRPRGYMDRVYRFSFCGFFPYENPKYTCIVVISHPRSGGNNAGIISGTVMLNTVNRMYSRGMLGPGPDFRNTGLSEPASMTIQATRKNHDGLVREFTGSGARGHRLITPGETGPGTVPNVVGLSLREAIVAIEERGYELKYKGTGAVVSQTPPAGQPLKKGQTIELTLSTRI